MRAGIANRLLRRSADSLLSESRKPSPYCEDCRWRRAAVLRIVLRWTQAAIAYRERARLKQALLYSRCRRLALALGDQLVMRGRLAEREDVFWLTVSRGR